MLLVYQYRLVQDAFAATIYTVVVRAIAKEVGISLTYVRKVVKIYMIWLHRICLDITFGWGHDKRRRAAEPGMSMKNIDQTF